SRAAIKAEVILGARNRAQRCATVTARGTSGASDVNTSIQRVAMYRSATSHVTIAGDGQCLRLTVALHRYVDPDRTIGPEHPAHRASPVSRCFARPPRAAPVDGRSIAARASACSAGVSTPVPTLTVSPRSLRYNAFVHAPWTCTTCSPISTGERIRFP